mmetsp:Transcript_12996/g.20168  ORF Transcript_12996/g.20168 Transcript_12996/m.20168 type:complete len:803 (+) Transcript_12996:151-2559(+)
MSDDSSSDDRIDRPPLGPQVHRRQASNPTPAVASINFNQLERQWSTGNGISVEGDFISRTTALQDFRNTWSTSSSSLMGAAFNDSFTNSQSQISMNNEVVVTEEIKIDDEKIGSDTIGSVIHDEARIMTWDKVLALCKSHPQHAKYANDGGWTALHHACNRRCDRADVVEALVKAYPGALLDLEDQGKTPLHYACRFKAPKDTVRVLLHNTPSLGHRAVSKRDRKGRTPLWYAVRYDAPKGVVEMLLEIDPSVVLEEDKAGESPLSLVWDTWAEKFEGKKTLSAFIGFDGKAEEECLSEENANSTVFKKSTEEIKELFQKTCTVNKKLHERWETANLFLKANFGFKLNTPSIVTPQSASPIFRMLHATAAIPCHPTLFFMAKALYPNQAREWDDHHELAKDDRQTALHLAAASAARGSLSRIVVKSLLELYPEAAKLKTSSNGSLPLHKMVENEHKQHWIHDGLRDLYQAYPAALHEVDSLGRLPLHRAAAANKHGGGVNGSIILHLIQDWPQAAEQADHSGRLPLHYVAEHGEGWEEESEGIYQAYPAATSTRAGPSASLPLHIACAAPDSRHDMLQKLVEFHPRATMQTDRNGKLPLHLLCESGKPWDQGVEKIYEAYKAGIKEPEQNERGWVALQIAAASPMGSSSFISRLTELHPKAAARKDADGRYSLHLACEAGKEWETGLQDIFNAYPYANSSSDLVGMLPFHIAALKWCCGEDDAKVRMSRAHLGVTASFHKRARCDMEENDDAIDQSITDGDSRCRSSSFLESSNAVLPDTDAPKIEILYRLLLANPDILLLH